MVAYAALHSCAVYTQLLYSSLLDQIASGSPLKLVRWCGASRSTIRAFPADARRELGHQLHRLQLGKAATDSKPFAAIGPGVIEIRIHSVQEYRMIAVSKFREAIYVLNVFVKRTTRTARRDVDLARQRYGVLLRERGQK